MTITPYDEDIKRNISGTPFNHRCLKSTNLCDMLINDLVILVLGLSHKFKLPAPC